MRILNILVAGTFLLSLGNTRGNCEPLAYPPEQDESTRRSTAPEQAALFDEIISAATFPPLGAGDSFFSIPPGRRSAVAAHSLLRACTQAECSACSTLKRIRIYPTRYFVDGAPVGPMRNREAYTLSEQAARPMNRETA